MFYLITHSTHFIYTMWCRTLLRNFLIKSEKTCCLLFMINSFLSAVWDLLYAISYRQDRTYHDLCYTSCGALGGMRNRSMGPLTGINPTTHHDWTTKSHNPDDIPLVSTIIRYSQTTWYRTPCFRMERDVALGWSVYSWFGELTDQSLTLDPLSYFSFQPVLHN